jgi:hypothetical protein
MTLPEEQIRYAKGKRNCNHDTFHMHAHTLAAVVSQDDCDCLLARS